MSTISYREALDLCREFLDDVYGTVKIGGLTYDTAHALELVDEVVFRRRK